MNPDLDLPKLSICLVTYERTTMALRTVISTIENLGYPPELIGWYVSDDGSREEHSKMILNALEKKNQLVFGQHNERIRFVNSKESHNAGLGWNKALGICHQRSDFVLFLEDDWELDQPLNILPHVRMLQEREDVGACSFRILSTGADVHTVGHNGYVYFRYDRTTQYAYSGNPYIRHARYTKRYGWFAEDRNPGLIELHQDDQYRLAIDSEENPAPAIWRPADISVWGAWKHIGSEKTWQ